MNARGRTKPAWALAVAAVSVVALSVAVLVATAGSAEAAAPSPRAAQPSPEPVPVLAYYYIWFNPSSWNRAKVDYPALGRYSSSDVAVMRRQVALAQKAGISGFLVGWKKSPLLDRRLEAIVRVARAAHFKLGLVFQGRDFERRALPMSQVRASFDYFAARYARNPVFNVFGKPVVIWSGTWMYTRPQLASITRVYRSRLTILASEKHPSSYQAIADLFQGNAYYWSSVDPLNTPGYQRKLDAFATTVHRDQGLWFAPAAPGYDARLIGGTRVVPRRGGETLRLEMNAAMSSSPDAIALISWNEFSENTYVEPSRDFGSSALKVLASVDHADPAAVPDFDTSGPSGFHAGPGQFLILGVLLFIFAGSAGLILLRGAQGGGGATSGPDGTERRMSGQRRGT